MSSTTVCMTDTFVVPFPTLDSPSTQASSITAGSPNRTAYSSPPLSFSDTSISDSDPPDIVDYASQGCSATYMRYDSGSSSSSTPSDELPPTIIPRSKRMASPHSTAIDPQLMLKSLTPASTPVKPRIDGRSFTDLECKKQTPLRDPSDDETTIQPFPMLKRPTFCKVGKLRLEGSSSQKHVRHPSDSNFSPSRTPLAPTPSANQPTQIIRKKSGQPIKSSLKGARRPELHVVTNGSFAKSEPATPTHTKAVHFDSKLEHVKLFLAEQKPLAVSRDGSPTSDTSGDEFPSFIYGDAGRDKPVKMLLPNMPSSPSKETSVALQRLVLSQDQRTITGDVRVRNIAYEKWLAIRFTLDWWQTTSEVTARYDRSVEGGAFDIFTFTIRLHDIWSRIEEKTIFIALRYTVAGQEHWDNNDGKNYHIKFVLEPSSEPSSAVDDTSLKDLNLRLEDLAKTRSAPIPITPYRLGRSFSADYQHFSFAKPQSARYDFVSGYKTQAKNVSPSPNRHTRTYTYPSAVPATAGPTVAPWSKESKVNETEKITTPSRPRLPPLSVGSAPEAGSVPTLPAQSKSVSPDSPSSSRSQDGRERNHRRGFVDGAMEGSPNLRKTPPGSPLKFNFASKDAAPQLPRTRTFPFIAEKPDPMMKLTQNSALKLPLSIQIAPVGGGGSEESTPYEGSQSSSSSDSSCTPLLSPRSDLSQGDTSYKQLLDQFCFYTGTDPLLQEPSEVIPRSHSTSRIEHLLFSHSPPPSFSSVRDLPARFPFDTSNQTIPKPVRV